MATDGLQRNIALVGAGAWGRNILRVLNEMGCLHTVCDSNAAVVQGLKDAFPEVTFTHSLQSVLSQREIQGVAISTPAATHYTIAEEALCAGKDLFVEKPLSLTVNEGESLVKHARENSSILMVGHILQYHPAVIKLKQIIDEGSLGEIYYIYSNRLNIGKLRNEENILWSFAPHDISAILMLLGEEPVKVSAFGADYINAGINDVTLTTMEFNNGVKAHVFVSWLHPYKEQKLIVVGSKAMAVFDDLTREKLFLYPHTIEKKDGMVPIANRAEFEAVAVEKGEPLRFELQHFIDCVATGRPPKTDGCEGVRVLRVLEKAEKSFAAKENIHGQKIKLQT